MATFADSKASSFTIQELTGEKRTLVLKGRALPYRPISFSGSMRADITWYPGNPEATVQFLGAIENETAITGMWKDRFLKPTTFDGLPVDNPDAVATVNGEPVFDVLDLVMAVDDFRRKGQILDVSWDEIIRRGVLIRFDQNWDRRQDVAWEMAFAWISHGEQTVPAVIARETDLATAIDQWNASLDELRISLQTPFERALTIKAGLIDETGSMEDSIAAIQAITGNSASGFLDTVDAARGLTATMNSIIGTGSEILDILGLQPDQENRHDVFVPPREDGTANETTVGRALSAALHARQTKTAARNMRYEAARQRFDFAKRVAPDLIATFVAQQDVDLREVSTVYYETPDEWKMLLTFNHLETSKLTAGQVIFVPQRRNAA